MKFFSLFLAFHLLSLSAFASAQDFKGTSYVRIDGGLLIHEKLKNASENTYRVIQRNLQKPDNSLLVSGGVGHYFSPNIRADFILSFMPNATVKGKINNSVFKNILDYTSLPTHTNIDYKIESFTGLANVYFDIPLSRYVTPYVTAGIGLAHNRLKSYYDSQSYLLGLVDFSTSHDETAANNIAWQWGGGAAFRVTDNVHADIGYRYADLGAIKARYQTSATVQTYYFGSQTHSESGEIKIDKLYSHQITAGLRFSF